MAAAQSSQHTFIQYAIGLTFTVLGLSIQTSRFGASRTADILELVAWLALLVSGMIGLARWEQVSQMYRLFGHQDSEDDLISKLQMARAGGLAEVTTIEDNRSEALEDTLARVKRRRQGIEELITAGNRRSRRLYNAQKALFGLGFLALVFARAFGPGLRILESLLRHEPY
jgi:hypothetical protein